MNWKDHANLFANGKFKVKDEYNGNIRTIEGYNEPDFILSRDNKDDSGVEVHTGSCILIARPISDMSEDEKAKWKHFIYDRNAPKSMISRYANQTSWLLSIGVYPFDQSHFETGEVLPA